MTTSISTLALMPSDAHPEAGGVIVPSKKAWRLLGKELDRYREDMLCRSLAEQTVKDVVWALGNMFDGLGESGLGIKRKLIRQAHIDYLVKDYYVGKEQSYVAHNLSLLRQYLKWAGNRQTDRIRWPVRGYGRPNAHWLEDHEAMVLKEEARGIERMIVHCELDLGMRRIEVLRLKVSSFRAGRANTILVHGKGRNGGKMREIPWGKDTPGELETYLRLRDAAVEKARAKNPAVEVPDGLLIYEARGQLRPYKKSAMENFLKDLSRRASIGFSNHTLRRTCGRMLFRAGAPIESIAGILGHSDTKTTMLYLGIDQQDMARAMDLLAQYQKSVKCPEKGTFGISQQNGGPCGIRDHETDWLTLENAPVRAPMPRREDLI